MAVDSIGRPLAGFAGWAWLTLSLLGVACDPGGRAPPPETRRTSSPEEAPFVHIPAGPFWRGCNPQTDEVGLTHSCAPPNNGLQNTPYRQITLSEFWIMRHEVTTAEYRACMDAAACSVPEAGFGGLNHDSPADFPAAWRVPEEAIPRMPATGISWSEARDYCLWRGMDLPTEAQWEKAARGTDGRRWPWGWDPPRCDHSNTSAPEPCPLVDPIMPVGTIPGDRSPYGVADMAGNVSEWTLDLFSPTYYETGPDVDPMGPAPDDPDVEQGSHSVRGGYSGRIDGRTYYRQSQIDTGRPGWIGFRCAATTNPQGVGDSA